MHGAGFREMVGGTVGMVPVCSVPMPRLGARCFGRGLWQNWKSRAAAEGRGEGVGLAARGLGSIAGQFLRALVELSGRTGMAESCA